MMKPDDLDQSVPMHGASVDVYLQINLGVVIINQSSRELKLRT